MPNPLFFKSLAVVGGVSVAAGAAIGIPQLLSNRGQTISELIKTRNPEKRLISSPSLEDSDWKKSWEAYRKDNKGAVKGKDTFQLPDWSGPISEAISDGVNALQSLLNACSEKSNQKVLPDSKLYKDVLSYCTRGTLISDLIKDSGKTALSKTASVDTKEWKDAWERYRLANKSSSTDVWGVNTFSTVKENANQSPPEDFRTKCETHLKSSDISNLELLERVKNWCTVEGKL
ncbi:hypothetical protein MHC_04560 [Mycoplasma haemocanis str. Illinois]|uniref:Uncharacterized protein n=1 Tax=Mycoplasma haemocanis (strain Illinois) TaxID=1111676 RepID=H6N7Z6_MYCHN|nr:hypothetical protein [Mycoplasma haemocanis]AEW45768.1 hypothetical protein MHC_04560 [Mycoplasma haemocanis str. Illinois]